MSLLGKLKEELFNAEYDYISAHDRFKAIAPNGVNFCYETVNSRQASGYAWYKQAQERLYTLQNFFEMKCSLEVHDKRVREIFAEYDNATNMAGIDAAYAKYFKLYTVKK